MTISLNGELHVDCTDIVMFHEGYVTLLTCLASLLNYRLVVLGKYNGCQLIIYSTKKVCFWDPVNRVNRYLNTLIFYRCLLNYLILWRIIVYIHNRSVRNLDRLVYNYQTKFVPMRGYACEDIYIWCHDALPSDIKMIKKIFYVKVLTLVML